MDTIVWIMVSVAILLAALLIASIIYTTKRGKKHKPDYYSMFILGICWLPLGMAMRNYLFSIMGLVFMAVGLSHQKEWKKNHKQWKDMKKNERKVMVFFLGALTLILVAGIAVLLLAKK